jgi:UDP-glucose 4-epimerase
VARVKLLLVGHRGFVGKALAKELVAQGADLSFFEGDLTDSAAVHGHFATDPGITRVVHLAGRFSGTWEQLVAANVTTTQNLLEEAHAAGVREFLYTSSGGVYGEPLNGPSKESDPLDPNTFYGLTKAAAESNVSFFSRHRGWQVSVLRYPALYGPGGQVGVVRAMLDAAVGAGVIRVHGDGQQVRQLVHVQDAVAAILRTIEWGGEGTFNITSPIVHTVSEIAEVVAAAVGGDVRIEHVPATNDLRALHMNGEKAAEVLGFSAAHRTLDLAGLT